MKKNSPSKSLRGSLIPNLVVQDGETFPLLCGECEQRFGKYESEFIAKFFRPFHEIDQRTYHYSEWLLRFAISVIWRASERQPNNILLSLTEANQKKVDAARNVWKRYLLEEIPSPGLHSVHLFPLNCVDSIDNISQSGNKKIPKVRISPYLNRFIVSNTLHMIAVLSNTDIVVVVKMCRVLLIGSVSIVSPSRWKGSLLRQKSGIINLDSNIRMPTHVFQFLNERADEFAKSYQDFRFRLLDRMILLVHIR